MRLLTTIYLLFFILILGFSTVPEAVVSPFNSLNGFKFFEVKNVDTLGVTAVETDSLKLSDCQRQYTDTIINSRIEEIDSFYDALDQKTWMTSRKLFEKYSHDVRYQLRVNNLSSCFQLLPIVLSAMNRQYTSLRNTRGIWQLSYPVAVRFGMTLNNDTDQRFDPKLSSKVAAKYLIFLIEKYKSEELALLAFLNSPSDLNYALARAGSSSFEELYPHLSSDTRDFYLAYQVMNYKFIELERKVFGLELPKKELSVDTLALERDLLTSLFVKFTKVDSNEISYLNPTFIGAYIPKSVLGYSLLVPSEVKVFFESIKDSIYKEQKRFLTPPKPKPITKPNNSKVTFYTIRSGDVLGSIASRFGVSVSKLKYWNRLSTDRINVGQKLKVYVDEKAYSTYKPKPKTVPVKTTNKQTGSNGGKIIVYTVQSGDNLWLISKKYPGVSSEDIMELNNIDENIDVGQKIKIKIP